MFNQYEYETPPCGSQARGTRAECQSLAKETQKETCCAISELIVGRNFKRTHSTMKLHYPRPGIVFQEPEGAAGELHAADDRRLPRCLQRGRAP